MELHTQTITAEEVQEAAQHAGVYLTTFAQLGSRKGLRKFKVLLEGSSRRRPNGGSSGAGSGYAATWDEWGMFLAQLFRIDPGMVCWAYQGAEHFHWVTGNRYLELRYSDQCRDHKWSGGYPSATGSYSTAECTREDCTAIRRWMLQGRKFSELTLV